MTTPPTTTSDDETAALLRRDCPEDDPEDIDRLLALASLRQELAGVPTAPVRFRQWEVERRLGRGGMGAVYLARHCRLGRRVALKLLRPSSERDLREAQALATIRHKNVVQIHQVDTAGDRTVIEMEFIDGPTLRTWASAAGRSWREIVGAYADAGDGLAAIHKAGLLHRDIKPDNLVRDAEGHVKIVDLGLAVSSAGLRPPVNPSGGEAARSALALRITADGAIVGTHGYIAPEVLADSQASPASDQFSLATSLYEALHGVLPFQACTPDALVAAMRHGTFTTTTATSPPPAWLLPVFRRALAFEPAARYATVDAFVRDLRDGLQRRRRWLLGGSVLAAVVALPAVGWAVKPPPEDPCAKVGPDFITFWSASVRNDLGERAAIDPSPHVARSLAQLMNMLDARTKALSDTRTRLCAADNTSGRNDLNTRQQACLDHARRNMQALVRNLQSAPDQLARRFTAATTALEALPTCEDTRSFAQWPLPTMSGSDDDALAEQLAQAAALEVAGEFPRAEAMARQVAETSANHHPLRHAESLFRLGHILGQQHHYTVAFATLDDARDAAFAVGHDDLFCQAAAFQAKLAANVGLDAASSARELGLAEACVRRNGTRNILLRADLLEARGLHALAAADPLAASRWHREALDLRRSHLGDEAEEIARSLQNLANARAAHGDHGALADYREALRLKEQLFGPDHVEVADALFDLGVFLTEATSAPEITSALEARAVLERAAAIFDRSPGALDAARARTHIALAILDLSQAPPSDSALHTAAAHLERARALLADASLGPSHPDRATLLEAEGLLALRRHDFRTAQRTYARASRILRRHDPTGLAVLDNIIRQIEAAYGAEDFTAIAAIARDEDPPLVDSLPALPPGEYGPAAWYIAEGFTQLSAPTEAAVYFRIALQAYQQLDQAPAVAELQWRLAQALGHDPAHADEALALARDALVHFQTLGARAEVSAITRWLKRHPLELRPTPHTP